MALLALLSRAAPRTPLSERECSEQERSSALRCGVWSSVPRVLVACLLAEPRLQCARSSPPPASPAGARAGRAQAAVYEVDAHLLHHQPGPAPADPRLQCAKSMPGPAHGAVWRKPRKKNLKKSGVPCAHSWRHKTNAKRLSANPPKTKVPSPKPSLGTPKS